MGENLDSNIPPEERRLRKRVFKDMKEIGRGENPSSEQDWDLIWVLSGPGIDIAEDFPEGKDIKDVIFLGGHVDDGPARRDAEKKINESRERLETGIEVAKKVAAKRLGKKVEELTQQDIIENAPPVYWNGTDEGNDNLRQRISEGFLEKYDFPAEKIIISPNLGIQHTGHQFEKIEDGIIEGKRKIVIVSDTYHLPRVKRYLDKKDSKINKENAVLYASEPKRVPVGKALGEIKKIPKYIKGGVLPEEPIEEGELDEKE